MRVEDAATARGNEEYRRVLTDFLYQLADDDLVLGHRDSEWLGMAPELEEDVAFSSIAQDEVGHATFYYDLLEALGEGRADDMAFGRSAGERKNALMVERENGDWAETIARHYLYDVWETVRLEALKDSGYVPLAQGAAKIIREERYHGLHMETWFRRLGRAGGEAKERLERGVQALWPELGDLFTFGSGEKLLVVHEILPVDPAVLYRRWEERVRPVMEAATLAWPGTPGRPEKSGREGSHTHALEQLLDAMGEVYRMDPAATW
ncbi:1,2-phenylacetyl-CoA epoxidase subunit PaaC [Kyrpidia sp.]|uniref:1,2-phenylacetyl-CoA epoxidase subunit PaaC n=1 Tax=Kyrpidia sp. TaxID=2073077 RepID=UPI002590515C|nr:1,2-phenylacetyl-CoA epoxidase subunit PaaC [Kyrpidia sp.]MCL6575890.1 phenylacetate-CoA oxygenase subunit PaaC [Kyrpidia sp.]